MRQYFRTIFSRTGWGELQELVTDKTDGSVSWQHIQNKSAPVTEANIEKDLIVPHGTCVWRVYIDSESFIFDTVTQRDHVGGFLVYADTEAQIRERFLGKYHVAFIKTKGGCNDRADAIKEAQEKMKECTDKVEALKESVSIDESQECKSKIKPGSYTMEVFVVNPGFIEINGKEVYVYRGKQILSIDGLVNLISKGDVEFVIKNITKNQWNI